MRRAVRVVANRWLEILVALMIAAMVGACDAAESIPAPARQPLALSAQPSPPSASVAVKLWVDRAGLYRVTAAQLRAAGFDPEAHDPDRLQLTVAGQPVVMQVKGARDSLELTFYGQPRQSRYGRENAYWLSWRDDGQAAVPAPLARQVTPGGGIPVEDFAAFESLEENNLYLSQTPPGSDHWLWQALLAPATVTVTVDLPGWAGGDAWLSVSLWANTEDPVQPDHHLRLELAGQAVADERWDGRGWHTITATLPAEILRQDGNPLTLIAPGDSAATVDMVHLDRVDVSYRRSLHARDGQLAFAAEAGQPLAIAGLGSAEALLWDVTDPLGGQPLEGAVVDESALRFMDAEGEGARAYVVSAPDARLTPKTIEPATARDLRSNGEGADAVVVSHADFLAAVQPLVDYRRSQGLRVTVASIDDVYDAFSGGMPDPAAIRDYMRYAATHWPKPAPRFLLLVGDASYDYQGFMPDGVPGRVPTYLLNTQFLGETASDNWLVSLDEGDGKPDMAVGRIPAQTIEQVRDVVAKTVAYEREDPPGPWVERALFVADNKQAEFQLMTDGLAANYLPDSYQIDRVYLGQSPDPSGEIRRSIRQGVGLVTYVGHGSMNVWAQEKIFQTNDVAALDNQALPFVVAMTCLMGYFHHPQATSMGEALLFKPAGGMVAGLVPTSETLASDQSQLANAIYRHLFGDAATIGEAVMLGKQDLAAENDMMQDLIETFTLLGDPMVKMKRPG